jgi:hypothetical protein
MAEAITLPAGKVIRAYTGLGIIGSEDHLRGRDRQCGEPHYLLLVCAGSWHNRSDDHATLDGLNLSRLSSGFV